MTFADLRCAVTKEEIEQHVRSGDADALSAFDGKIVEPRLSAMKLDLGCLVSFRDRNNVFVVRQEGTPLFLAVVLAVAEDDELQALAVVEALLRHCCVSVMSKAEEPVLDFVVDACLNRNNSAVMLGDDTVRRMRAVMDVFVATLVSADDVKRALLRVLAYGSDFVRDGADDVPTTLVENVLYVMGRADWEGLERSTRRVKPVLFSEVVYVACGSLCRIESFGVFVGAMRERMLAFRGGDEGSAKGVNGFGCSSNGALLCAGDTVLHVAARQCLRGAYQSSKVKYLVENGFGALAAVRNADGKSPRDVVAELDLDRELVYVQFGAGAVATTYRWVRIGGQGRALMVATRLVALELLHGEGRGLGGDVWEKKCRGVTSCVV